MNYIEALKYINNCAKFGKKSELERICRILELMNNPQNSLKYVHIAGTNGKGSTSAFINNVLIQSGYKVGLYTSPYIQQFSERIQINNTNISSENITHLISDIKNIVKKVLKEGFEQPTQFELITAMAFQYFFEQQCDIVVLETGIGGRLDSTNIINEAEVSVITTIDYDHMDILGNSLVEIAGEKAGIIKKNATVVLYPQKTVIENLFENYCKNKKATLKKVSFENISIINRSIECQKFNYNEYNNLTIKMLGINQIYNCVMAINIAEQLIKKGYNITEDTIRKGLISSKWPGRFEVVNKFPTIVIDGAHNRQGANMLSKNLEEYFCGKKIIFIFGVLTNKEYKLMINAVKHLASKFIVVMPKSDNALNSSEIAKYIDELNIEFIIQANIKIAVKDSISKCGSNEIICAFGSLYYIGEIRSFFIS